MFAENRRQLSDKLKPGSIALLFASHQMPRNGDQYHPYRQNSDFFYFTGIEQEKSILLLAPHGKEVKEILFILSSNKMLEIWEGHKLTAEEAIAISAISTVRCAEDFMRILHPYLYEAQHIFFNIPDLPKHKPEVKSRDEDFLDRIKQQYPLHSYEPLAPMIRTLRLRKSAGEIEKIQEACSITREAFLAVLKNCKPGKKEYELEATITYEFIKRGASGHAYAPIIASGKNACVLHYIENNSTCENGELLLFDFGAEYANYAADLSRTIPVNGRFTKRQREVYEANLRVFRYAKSLMKPGTTINEIHTAVCKNWEEEHIRLGLYSKSDVNKYVGENGLWYNYYMHGTSHFLGLDVHDTGAKDTCLEAGMVLTCEPAIYITEESLGVRIENDILITEAGHIDLMDNIPVEAAEIEELMH
jgi:Xaa-Pro aminopeptidase